MARLLGEETYEPRVFDIRFPAASYQGRIPDSLATINFVPTMAPARTLTASGTDRSGAGFNVSVDTSSLAGSTSIDLVRSALGSGDSQQEALADVIEDLLGAAGFGTLFERPSVVWQDDGDQAGSCTCRWRSPPAAEDRRPR